MEKEKIPETPTMDQEKIVTLLQEKEVDLMVPEDREVQEEVVVDLEKVEEEAILIKTEKEDLEVASVDSAEAEVVSKTHHMEDKDVVDSQEDLTMALEAEVHLVDQEEEEVPSEDLQEAVQAQEADEAVSPSTNFDFFPNILFI
jgi:hypothetical protein